VIVQCKHWLSRSVNVKDLLASLETVHLSEPPPVDVLVVATSGLFTQDAAGGGRSGGTSEWCPLWSFGPKAKSKR
jgi:hypothetical protein